MLYDKPMVKLLPFIIVPILVLGGLGYWRYVVMKQSLTAPQIEAQIDASVSSGSIEVPKSLPQASLDDRVKSLEDIINKLVPQVNSLKQPVGSQVPAVLDSRVSTLEAAVVDLKARVSALEKNTTVQTASTKLATSYIPLGSGGGGGDKGWYSLSSYGATIDPAEYPGYTSIQLEVNFRLSQKSGIAYARFYNSTDNSAKEQVSTTADVFNWQTSTGFTLPAGKKSYTLQIKSSEGVEIEIHSARIKVNF